MSTICIHIHIKCSSILLQVNVYEHTCEWKKGENPYFEWIVYCKGGKLGSEVEEILLNNDATFVTDSELLHMQS